MTVLDSNTGGSHQPIAADAAAAESSTVCFHEGPLRGYEGIIVERRKSGRYLIQLHQGVYVEANLVEFSPIPAASGSADA